VLAVYLDVLGYDQFDEFVRKNALISALVTNATGLVSLAAVDASFAFTPPSVVAAACLCTAFNRSGMNFWPTLLQELAGLEERDSRLVNCMETLQRLTF